MSRSLPSAASVAECESIGSAPSAEDPGSGIVEHESTGCGYGVGGALYLSVLSDVTVTDGGLFNLKFRLLPPSSLLLELACSWPITTALPPADGALHVVSGSTGDDGMD